MLRLFAAGVGLSAITRSLQDIRKWLPDAGLSNLKLFPAARERRWRALQPFLLLGVERAVDALKAAGYRNTDISVLFPVNEGIDVVRG